MSGWGVGIGDWLMVGGVQWGYIYTLEDTHLTLAQVYRKIDRADQDIEMKGRLTYWLENRYKDKHKMLQRCDLERRRVIYERRE